MKGKALGKHNLHGKTAASVLLKLFIIYIYYHATTLVLYVLVFASLGISCFPENALSLFDDDVDEEASVTLERVRRGADKGFCKTVYNGFFL